MCGIFGLWDPHGTLSVPPGEIAALVERGTSRLNHRGPDGSGVWSDNDNRLALGHRRLSIVDLSETGRQPMASADGRWVITFNGEIYNHRSIREELCRAGTGFRGTSDTEVLVEAIARWGVESTLQKSRGMFAFALWDRVDNELTVARDRVGEKPLYISVSNRVLAFASEVTALATLPNWPLSINREAIWDLLQFGYIRGDKCIYDSVLKLPPGSFLRLSSDALSGPPKKLLSHSQHYWSLTESPPPLILSDHDCTNHFESLIEDSIREQLVADVPVGAFLSGGLDSSLVVSIAARISSQPLSTFTIGFSDASYDESEWARRIAERVGSAHHEIQVSEHDLISSIPTMTQTYDEPFADPSQVPTYLVSKFARQKVKVALTGDGGDELFCGYNRYIQFRKACELMDKLPRAARQILGRSLQSVPVAPLEALVKSGRRLTGAQSPVQSPAARLHKIGKLMQLDQLDDRYAALLSTMARETLILGFSANSDNTPRPSVNWSLENIEDHLMRNDVAGYLPDNGLVKLDRASMRVSLEARAPFLDARIIQDAFRIPLSQKVRHGKGKWIFRSVLAKYLPTEFFERPKAGFSVPVADWLRGPLKTWICDTLSTDRLVKTGILDPAEVQRLLNQHIKGDADHARVLWAIVMMESWLSQ